MMRKVFIFLFACLMSLGLIAQSDHECKDLDALIELEKSRHIGLLSASPNVLTNNYDIKYHRMDWVIDPAVLYISGTVTTYFIPTIPYFKEINFDLVDNMIINDIVYHGMSLDYELNGHNLQIDLPNFIEPFVLDSISIQYEGEPTSEGFGSFANDLHEGTPVLWTLSEPYGAKTWWPCKQDLNDKIDSIDIFVTTPSIYRVGSNGMLVEEKDMGNDETRYHWKHRYPIPAYLISIAVTNYAVFTDYVHINGGDSFPILNYVFPEDLSYAKDKLYSTVEQMELFNDLFGLYPFANEKYGHAQFGWGGGMEHQTMSSMGGFSYKLQAHELAHQWFGDMITCGSWEDIWLNEGFATYAAALANEFLTPDPNDFSEWLEYTMQFVTSQPGGSTWVDDTTSVGRIFNSRLSYRKGSLILHMLRWKMGDEQFFSGIRNYLQDPNLAYGYAKTHDLQGHLEEISGLDLTEYFNDWFYGQGFPTYLLKYSLLPDGISIILEQSTSHQSVDFFEMPVPVYLSDGLNDSTVILDHQFSGQEFLVPLSFVPNQVLVDPEQWIISRNDSVAFVPTSVNNLMESDIGIDIYPNPATQEIQIISHNIKNRSYKLAISNSQGSIIMRRQIHSEQELIDISILDGGVYFILIEHSANQEVLKLIKL